MTIRSVLNRAHILAAVCALSLLYSLTANLLCTVLLITLLIYSFLKERDQIGFNPLTFVMFVFAALSFVKMWGMVHLYPGVFKKEIVATLNIGLCLLIFKNQWNREDVQKFQISLATMIVFFSTLFSLASFLRFALILGNFEIPYYLETPTPHAFTSIRTDYNVQAFLHLVALVSTYYLFVQFRIRTGLFLFFSGLFYFTVLFGGSRRGFMVLVVWIAVLGCYEIFRRHKSTAKKLFHAVLIAVALALPLTFSQWISYGVNHIIQKMEELDKDSNRSHSFRNLVARYESGVHQSEMAPRVDRLKYAGELFLTAPWDEQLVGSGFKYITSFSQHFEFPEGDYPHNYLLSALLSGGFIEFLYWFSLSLVAAFFVLKHRKEYLLVLHGLWIFAGFAMSSGNSPYSNPFFTILLLFVAHQFYSLYCPLFRRKKA